jgi:hypothetical protein
MRIIPLLILGSRLVKNRQPAAGANAPLLWHVLTQSGIQSEHLGFELPYQRIFLRTQPLQLDDLSRHAQGGVGSVSGVQGR